MVDKYTWVDIGSSYLLQISGRVSVTRNSKTGGTLKRTPARMGILLATLGEWAGNYRDTIAGGAEDCDQAYHMFYILLALARLPPSSDRTSQRPRAFSASFTYVSVTNLSTMERSYAARKTNARSLRTSAGGCWRLPFFNDPPRGNWSGSVPPSPRSVDKARFAGHWGLTLRV